MGGFSRRSILILLAILAFVHFGTPLIADLLFELYHLVKIEGIYSAYGIARFVTAQFMFWSNRWIVTLLVALLGFAFLWFRKKRRAAKEHALKEQAT